jgi:hypothetical protein
MTVTVPPSGEAIAGVAAPVRDRASAMSGVGQARWRSRMWVDDIPIAVVEEVLA